MANRNTPLSHPQTPIVGRNLRPWVPFLRQCLVMTANKPAAGLDRLPNESVFPKAQSAPPGSLVS